MSCDVIFHPSFVGNKENLLLFQIKLKEEKADEVEEARSKCEGGEENTGVKEELELGGGAESKAPPTAEMGRLVMTVNGQQKQLPFGPNDLLTAATMMDGDKARCHYTSEKSHQLSYNKQYKITIGKTIVLEHV